MKRVEFKTVDGTILRGDLTVPAVVLINRVSIFSQTKTDFVLIIYFQLTFLKEHGSAAPAKQFSEAGLVTLSYDQRSWGSSDGIPRQRTNLFQQVEDMSDAITFMATLPEVDGNHIAI